MRLRTLLATYPHTAPLKNGEVTSDRVALDFIDVTPVWSGFKAMVLAASGEDTATLADFELKPRKVTVVSPEVRAAAAAKAAATRKALGTKGTQQKKAAKKALAAQPAAAPVPVAPPVTAPKA